MLLELQAPGLLASLGDIEMDHAIFDIDIGFATPKIGNPVFQGIFADELAILD